MKRTKTSTTLILLGIIIAIGAAVTLFLVHQENEGYDFFMISSGSMEPVFEVGDIVKVDLTVTIDEIYAAPKHTDPPGDVIAFLGPSNIIVHRTVEKTSHNSHQYVRTQGDANSGSAPWELSIGQGQLVGKVVEINPLFWTYSDFFYLGIIGVGATFALVGLILFFVTSTKRIPKINELTLKKEDPIHILNVRFAKGEITKEQYDELKDAIEN
jgi:signal peptidase I